MYKVDIFGVKYTATDYHGATNAILEWVSKKRNFSVFALPVHGVIERRRDVEFRTAIDNAGMVLPDGQPIKWAMNYFHGTRLKDRVYGPELLRSVLLEANKRSLKIFLYGGSTQRVLSEFGRYIEREFPRVQISGTYREEKFGETTLSNEWVRSLQPDIILVGLGCPNQEKWISKNSGQIGGVFMGVGAAFSFYSGETKMAPVWMQRRGLEWLFRIITEPRRLWKRYLYTNTYFIYLVILKMLRIKKDL